MMAERMIQDPMISGAKFESFVTFPRNHFFRRYSGLPEN